MDPVTHTGRPKPGVFLQQTGDLKEPTQPTQVGQNLGYFYNRRGTLKNQLTHTGRPKPGVFLQQTGDLKEPTQPTQVGQNLGYFNKTGDLKEPTQPTQVGQNLGYFNKTGDHGFVKPGACSIDCSEY